jgi:hypothetical protein
MGRPSAFPRSFWLTILAFTIIVNLTMTRAVYFHLVEIKANIFHSTWGGMLLVFLGIAVACIWLMVRIIWDRSLFIEQVERFTLDGSLWRVIGAVVFIGVVYLIPYVKFAYKIGQDIKQPVYDPVFLLLLYYWMCWWMILLATTSLKIALRTTWQGGFGAALILLSTAFEIYFRYSFVSDYPLSMGWSEGSRYYYASLFFSKLVYGKTFPLPTLHPTRYLLQSFPFLFPSLGIYAHRFWQFLLWIGLTAGASIAIAKRVFNSEEKALSWLTAGWLFLFLLRVGVYYHLEVMVILPLLFIDMKKPRQSLLIVIIASLWAGISRVNWFPMPALLAIALYLLETPLTSTVGEKTSFKRLIKYLSQPVLWLIVGLPSALFAQWAYIYLSGNAQNAEAFTSSFTSDLLWYRLWANENFPLGVIPAILILSGPLLIVFILAASHWRSLHSIRWLGLIGMVVTLFAGSAVVSTKIGGGGDLHNMDTYAVMIGVVALHFFSGRVLVEPGKSGLEIRPFLVSAIALVIPVMTLIPILSPYPYLNKERNLQAHQQLVDVVNQISKQGPVLFISDRQLVALGDVNVPLVYDYEVVTMMEMAMSGNQAYLQHFYNDLDNHRFAAIISGRQNLTIKQDGVFAEENNVWNTLVSPYILCNYESSMTIEADITRIEVYRPRTQTQACPSGNSTE